MHVSSLRGTPPISYDPCTPGVRERTSLPHQEREREGSGGGIQREEGDGESEGGRGGSHVRPAASTGPVSYDPRRASARRKVMVPMTFFLYDPRRAYQMGD